MPSPEPSAPAVPPVPGQLPGDNIPKNAPPPTMEELKQADKLAVLEARVRAKQGFKDMSAWNKFLIAANNMGMAKQRSLFIESLGLMLGAGLPLIEALRAFRMEMRGRAGKKFVAEIILGVESGQTLWRVMSKTTIFTQFDVALVRIGEESGNLARNMAYLAEQLEKDRALTAKVRTAMIYPAIVLILMFVVGVGLGIFVLPNLVSVLISLNAKLPLTTRMIIKASEIFQEYGTIIVPLFIIIMGGAFFLYKYTRFGIAVEWVVFRIPGIGRLAREATIAHFGIVLGGLLRAGVPLTDAMNSLVEVTNVVAYKAFYRKLFDNIMLGNSFLKSFDAIPESKTLLPASVQQLVLTGERSGALSEVLVKISEIYDKKASETAEKLPVVLEPMLLLIVGGLVAMIAFSIIVPIYSVVGNIGGQ